jgi:serine/threonine-protein kinase HipA
MSVLAVWLGDEHVATLEQTRSRELRLRYTAHAIAVHGLGSVALSAALPVAARHHGRPVEFWAESMLPEAEARTAIEERFGVRRGDTFALLEAIGADCAGAVSFLPDGRSPNAALASAAPLAEQDLAQAIDGLPTRPLGVDDDVRVSLGGIQAKLLLVRLSDGRWASPRGGAPSTHIAKPDPLAFPGLVTAEAFTLALAAAAGVGASGFELRHDWGERPVLVLRRFDRSVIGDSVTRLHQEDGSAALGVDPAGGKKNQSLDPDSPTLARLADLLSRHGASRPADLSALARAVILRIAVGDTDGHVRNFGFLHRDQTISLAPAYDVAPTSLFVSGSQVGLWVDGQSYLSAITRGHLLREFAVWRLPGRLGAGLLKETLTQLAEAIPAAQQAVASAPDRVVDAVAARIRRLQNSPL